MSMVVKEVRRCQDEMKKEHGKALAADSGHCLFVWHIIALSFVTGSAFDTSLSGTISHFIFRHVDPKCGNRAVIIIVCNQPLFVSSVPSVLFTTTLRVIAWKASPRTDYSVRTCTVKVNISRIPLFMVNQDPADGEANDDLLHVSKIQPALLPREMFSIKNPHKPNHGAMCSNIS